MKLSVYSFLQPHVTCSLASSNTLPPLAHCSQRPSACVMWQSIGHWQIFSWSRSLASVVEPEGSLQYSRKLLILSCYESYQSCAPLCTLFVSDTF